MRMRLSAGVGETATTISDGRVLAFRRLCRCRDGSQPLAASDDARLAEGQANQWPRRRVVPAFRSPGGSGAPQAMRSNPSYRVPPTESFIGD